VEEPSTQTHFLDLNIKIENFSIVFSTYQKLLYLYLYIPISSAHPASCRKGLIRGESNRYWLQNQPINFQYLVVKFIESLHARGHSIEHLKPILLQAVASLDSICTCNKNNANNKNTLYIHWTYHPKEPAVTGYPSTIIQL
jgi:hypothetical protein